eukprot:2506822-Rhodomonas_salina.2
MKHSLRQYRASHSARVGRYLAIEVQHAQRRVPYAIAVPGISTGQRVAYAIAAPGIAYEEGESAPAALEGSSLRAETNSWYAWWYHSLRQHRTSPKVGMSGAYSSIESSRSTRVARK